MNGQRLACVRSCQRVLQSLWCGTSNVDEHSVRMHRQVKEGIPYSHFVFCASSQIGASAWQNQQNVCALSKDSDHLPSLIRVFAVCSGYLRIQAFFMRTTKTLIRLGIRPVWSESSLRAQWVSKDRSFLHADSEDSDQTGRMPSLIWVFAGRTCHFVGFLVRWLNYYSIHSPGLSQLSIHDIICAKL